MCLSCFLLILFNFSTSRGPLKTKASLANRPPRQKDRLPSFGRNTLAFEDGIVPSTPVLSSHSSNDGFADSSHQVDTRSARISRISLKVHKLTHSNAKNYECATCNQRFKTSSNLRVNLYLCIKKIKVY